jgi:IS30 family transposase
VYHETIYKSLFIQTRGVLKKELIACLQTQRLSRGPKKFSLKRTEIGKVPEAISIRERPASVEDRAIRGHWKGDLIEGTKNNYIAALIVRNLAMPCWSKSVIKGQIRLLRY